MQSSPPGVLERARNSRSAAADLQKALDAVAVLAGYDLRLGRKVQKLVGDLWEALLEEQQQQVTRELQAVAELQELSSPKRDNG